MTYAVLFDLDSTIANTYHRQHMVEAIHASKNTGPTWDDYSMACAGDTPIESTVTLMRMLANDYEIYIITGRSAAARTLTEGWLWANKIPWTGLYMRPAGDRTPNGVFKVQQIEKLRDLGIRPVLFVEDYAEAAEYITEHTGIPVLLVNANYPADAAHNNENSRGV